jgi:cell division protease FtsH
VLLAGAPGTGKTLLAKAIAAESGVKMFTCSGTDFYDVYTGVGARRIRETFEMLRNFAPAVLFIDEFDALGAARGAAAAGDESASIINEMLVQVRCAGLTILSGKFYSKMYFVCFGPPGGLQLAGCSSGA